MTLQWYKKDIYNNTRQYNMWRNLHDADYSESDSAIYISFRMTITVIWHNNCDIIKTMTWRVWYFHDSMTQYELLA